MKINPQRVKISVFTPTYNRAPTLERLYHSLQSQTFTDFEWLVIDDGSKDGTKALFDKWLTQENSFPIHYHYKENGGKHTAINLGLDKARGELFFAADSDDFLTGDALEKINSWVNALPTNEKFCGVAGNMGYTETETPNTIFDAAWRDATLLERYPDFSRRPIDGERVWVFFTNIHRKYKYPVFKNENFMTEAVAWNRMAKDGYKIRVFNDIIYIYKYLPNGLTLSGSQIFHDSPKGFALWMVEKAKLANYSQYQMLHMFYGYYLLERDKISKKQMAENLGTFYLVIVLLSSFYQYKIFVRRIFNR